MIPKSINQERPLGLLGPSMLAIVKKISFYSFLSAIAMLLGFARELVVASKFGLSKELDVFVAVMGFHLFFGVQIGNALETTFVSKVAKKGDVKNVKENLRDSFLSLLIVNIVISVFLVVLSESLIKIIFPSFDAQQTILGVSVINCFIISIMLANISGLMRGGLNVLRIFTPGFLSGSVISIFSIIFVVLFADKVGINALVYGFIAGNFFVLVVFLSYLIKHGVFSVKLISNNFSSSIFYIWGAASIVLIGEILFQAFSITERSLASTLQVGTISSFFYASTIIAVPLALLVVPLTTTLFPHLVKTFPTDKREGVRILRRYGGVLFLFAIGIVFFLSIFSEVIVGIVFVRGKFSIDDANRTAAILAIIVFALPFMSVARLIRYSFYSLSDYRTPVYGNLIIWLVLMSIGSYLVPAFGAKGLALSSVIATGCGTTIMTILLIRKLRYV